MGKHKEYYNCDVSTVLKIFPDALACHQEENAVNFGSCEYERAAKRRRLEAELEENALRADAKRAEELKEQQHKQKLRRQEQEADLSELEFKLKKSKLERELLREKQEGSSSSYSGVTSSSSHPVTLEAVTEFVSECLVFADTWKTASNCGEIRRALAAQKYGMIGALPHSFTAACRVVFESAGFKSNLRELPKASELPPFYQICGNDMTRGEGVWFSSVSVTAKENPAFNDAVLLLDSTDRTTSAGIDIP